MTDAIRSHGFSGGQRAARVAFAAFLALHGLVHWIGFAVPFGLMTTESNTYTTSALWGTLEIGDTGARVLGLAYLVAIVPFLVAAWGILRGAGWTRPVVLVAAALSAVVCALGSPNAVIGLVIDIAVIAVVVLVPWLASPEPAG